MKKVRVGGHPARYWHGGFPLPIRNEAQEGDLWNAMSKEFTGKMTLMVFPRKWNRASGRELHFELNNDDNNRYIDVGKEVGTLIAAYLGSGKKERTIIQSVANVMLKPLTE